jgi:hypothetical protein
VRRSVCSIALLLVCLDWKSDSFSYRTHLPFDSKVATLPPVRMDLQSRLTLRSKVVRKGIIGEQETFSSGHSLGWFGDQFQQFGAALLQRGTHGTPHCVYTIFSSFAALHLPFNSLPAFAPVGIEATPGDCFPKFRLVPWHPCLTHPIHVTLKLGKST